MEYWGTGSPMLLTCLRFCLFAAAGRKWLDKLLAPILWGEDFAMINDLLGLVDR
jgi:hypothetical protein